MTKTSICVVVTTQNGRRLLTCGGLLEYAKQCTQSPGLALQLLGCSFHCSGEERQSVAGMSYWVQDCFLHCDMIHFSRVWVTVQFCKYMYMFWCCVLTTVCHQLSYQQLECEHGFHSLHPADSNKGAGHCALGSLHACLSLFSDVGCEGLSRRGQAAWLWRERT